MSTPKIVRKKILYSKAYGATSFWLDEVGILRAWFEPHRVLAEDAAARLLGWEPSPDHAEDCGTTLAEIRAELLAPETPAPDAPLTASEREELVRLRKFAGWTMASHTGVLDGWEIEQKATELGLMVAGLCNETCGNCESRGMEVGSDLCYRPRYDEDGTPIGEVGG